jgi:hypothetical protein
MRRTRFVAIVLAALACTASAASPSCVGTGCPYIKIDTSDGCVSISNIGTDPIVVRPTSADIGASTIGARSHAKPTTADGKCIANYDIAYTAFVQATASTEGCTKVRNMSELGWQGEHKEKFCKSKGFTRPTNFQNASYRDYGGGFCYTGNDATCLKLMKGYPR